MARLRDPLTQELASSLVNEDRQVRRILAKIDKRLTERPELWGAGEAASFLGIRHNNMYKLRDFPEPIYDKPRGRLWLADDVRTFAERRG